MITLDTSVLIWWIDNPQKLSVKARQTIEAEKRKKGTILISSISTLEIYRLVKNGKLQLTTPVDSWLEKIESLPFVQFVPVDNKIAAQSVNLPDFFHKDPADRIIIATAKVHNALLVTSDEKIRAYPHVRTLW